MECKCGCGVTLKVKVGRGRQRFFATDACRKRTKRDLKTDKSEQKVFSGTKADKASSLETGCICVPANPEDDCSACKRAGMPCTHKFYWCVEHQYHIKSYCERMCA